MSLTVLLAVAFVGAALYYVCPLRLRWVLLLLLSYGFYLTCGLSALPFIALTTLTTWAGALVIARVGESGKAYLRAHKAELTADGAGHGEAMYALGDTYWDTVFDFIEPYMN